MWQRRRELSPGQVSLEFAILLVSIVAALLAMQAYIKRSVQGKLRQSADELGGQYDPNTTESLMTASLESDVTTYVLPVQTTNGTATETTTVINKEIEERHGEEVVGSFAESGGLFY